MPTSILDDRGPLDAARLAAAEASMGVSLPDGYRAFLLRHNGGRPARRYFDITWQAAQTEAMAAADGSLMGWFFGVHDGDASNLLLANQVDFKGRLPQGTVAIAQDPGGNLLLLRTSGPRQGEVLYWLRELEAEAGTPPGEHNVGHVADSFDAFLDQLH